MKIVMVPLFEMEEKYVCSNYTNQNQFKIIII